MKFIEPDLELVLKTMEPLNAQSQPLWGTMSAQRMVEHLTDTLLLALGKTKVELEIPEDKIEKAQAFLMSDKPLPRNFEVGFAKKDTPLRHEELDLAIDEFVETWIAYMTLFEENPQLKTMHPSFGLLDFDLWQRLNSKHLTHHLEQFGLIA